VPPAAADVAPPELFLNPTPSPSDAEGEAGPLLRTQETEQPVGPSGSNGFDLKFVRR